MEMRMLRYALIGCGRIAKRHIQAALENRLHITALCDLETKKAYKLVEEHNLRQLNKNIAVYSSYQKMISEQQPDMVAIATESGSHAPIALFCLKQGLHVLIEKPIALNDRDAVSIIHSAKENNRQIGICHQNRFNQAVQYLWKAVANGSLGQITHATVNIRWHRSRDYYRQSPWRGTWLQDGGVIMNQCIHGIDLLLWMMGSPVSKVYGATRNFSHPFIEAEDCGVAVIEFANGTLATLEGSASIYEPASETAFYIFGLKGAAKIGGPALNILEKLQAAAPDLPLSGANISETVINVYGNSHPKLYADMIQAVNTGKAPLVSAADGKRAMDVALAIYKSQRDGKSVDFPASGLNTRDMLGYRWSE